jgi:hypothetical protein
MSSKKANNKNEVLIRKSLHSHAVKLVKKYNHICKKEKLPGVLDDLIFNHYSEIMKIIHEFTKQIYETKRSGAPKKEREREFFRSTVINHQLKTKSMTIPTQRQLLEELDRENEKIENEIKRIRQEFKNKRKTNPLLIEPNYPKKLSISEKQYENLKKEFEEGLYGFPQ